MAYMNQTKKALIAAELKKVVPLDWKYSLGVQNHSTIVMFITEAPVDLLAFYNKRYGKLLKNNIQVNDFYPEHFFEGEILGIFRRIIKALNTGNHNNSDIMSDYYDVGHYVRLEIGRYNKPFKYINYEEMEAV